MSKRFLILAVTALLSWPWRLCFRPHAGWESIIGQSGSAAGCCARTKRRNPVAARSQGRRTTISSARSLTRSPCGKTLRMTGDRDRRLRPLRLGKTDRCHPWSRRRMASSTRSAMPEGP